MHLAQFPHNLWKLLEKAAQKIKKEKKISKISGRLLKPIDGVHEDLLTEIMEKFVHGEIMFKEMCTLCLKSKVYVLFYI